MWPSPAEAKINQHGQQLIANFPFRLREYTAYWRTRQPPERTSAEQLRVIAGHLLAQTDTAECSRSSQHPPRRPAARSRRLAKQCRWMTAEKIAIKVVNADGKGVRHPPMASRRRPMSPVESEDPSTLGKRSLVEDCPLIRQLHRSEQLT